MQLKLIIQTRLIDASDHVANYLERVVNEANLKVENEKL